MSFQCTTQRDVHGWLVLDKPIGKTSTLIVSILKRIMRAKKVGHAGTLDPLASGVLPIAFGEATKTVSFVMDGRKIYRFKVCWGAEMDTDDSEGEIISTSGKRPARQTIQAALPSFVGTIEQTPPRFSALKINGKRAYDLARQGRKFSLRSRAIEIERLTLVEIPDADHAVFEAECGKGTYVRALARDLGRTFGCFGHVCELRRTKVGSFTEENSITLEMCEKLTQEKDEALIAALLPVESSLGNVPAFTISVPDAERLAQGQTILLRGRDAPIIEGIVWVSTQGSLVALAEVERGALHPRRIFHLPRYHTE